MIRHAFSKGEAIAFGWRTATHHLGFFILVVIVVILMSGSFNGVGTILQIGTPSQRPTPALGILFRIVGEFFAILMSIGFIKIALAFVDDQRTSLGELFSGTGVFLRFLIASIIIGVIATVGFIVFIIPGIYLVIRLQFATYAIVDRGLGPIAAIRESWALTRGVTWNLFLFGILLFLINLAGFFALLVGLFVTYPLTSLAIAYVYRQLQNQGAPIPA